MERSKLTLIITAHDFPYSVAFESWQGLIHVLARVDFQRAWLPVPFVTLKNLICDILEQNYLHVIR